MNIEEEILKTVYDTSPDAIVVIDEKGTILSFNRSAERMFGHAAKETIGQNVKMLMPPYFAEQHDGFLNRYMTTGEKRIIGIGRIVTGIRKDGSTFPLELSIGEAQIKEKRLFTGFLRDLTEYQQTEQRVHELQEELLHASRLASLGEVSSMIAHEANQPLSAAATFLEVARELLETGKPADHQRGIAVLGKVGVQIQRVAETVRRVREFARKRTPELEQADINRVIEEANGIATVGMRGRGVRTFFDLAPALPMVEVDRIQIQQVIMNLVRNGIDAMDGQTRREIVLRSQLNLESMVEISVTDSGTGVADEMAASLFKPFMTTKKDGTGLGLAICRSIIEAHGGKLWHEANPQGGAIFKFTLPMPAHSQPHG